MYQFDTERSKIEEVTLTTSQLLPEYEEGKEQEQQKGELRRKEVELEMKDQQQRKGKHQKSDGQGHKPLQQGYVHPPVYRQQQQQHHHHQKAQHQVHRSRQHIDPSDAQNSMHCVKSEISMDETLAQISLHHSLHPLDLQPLLPVDASISTTADEKFSLPTAAISGPLPPQISVSMQPSALLIEEERTAVQEVRTVQSRFHHTSLYCPLLLKFSSHNCQTILIMTDNLSQAETYV